ncbi:ribosomal protein L34e-domain-containing protein [Boletus edulis BED1]|uniref:Large ribosomal subunit protein eL34 n=1 Tax=Boletus edulis BED1 TaxID=1328754 RepID=A0AAD4GKF6_BOLED|nr:ribosomal protein L34e-domain-containing protein [Boletus edulis BED1]
MLHTTLRQGRRCCQWRQYLKAYFTTSSTPWLDRPPPRKADKEKFNFNPDLVFSADVPQEYLSYPFVTSNDLAKSFTIPPTRVRMLVRDYIEDALYNPHYGYFSKQATIFTAPGEENQGFDFSSFKDTAQFEAAIARRYVECGSLSETEGPGKQVWHTPTELFKPWYGQAIAQCLLSEYLLKYFPYEDFKIYELGAGNGTLALNILNHLRAYYPEVYDRTVYTIIEISHGLRTANVEHRSVFSWTKTEYAPCYILATEVVDNFAHDLVRYDIRTLEPFQGSVAINGEGEFIPYYTRITDPLIASFPLSSSTHKAPTPFTMLSLLRLLRAHFPRHRLLLTDFCSLPDAVPGANAPVVQTNVRGTMVPCQTIFVRQGYFDILFPTRFEQLRDMYEYVLEQPVGTGDNASDLKCARLSPFGPDTPARSLDWHFFSPSSRRLPLDGVNSASGLPVGERKSSVFSHAEFMETYGNLDKTRLRNGENPMLAYYKNYLNQPHLSIIVVTIQLNVVMAQRVTLRKRNPYNTTSNRRRIVKTPGGRLVYHHLKKPPTQPKCGDCGVGLPGVPALRPRQYATVSKRIKTVRRAYGGSRCGDCVKSRILRAFLVEEAKIVKKVIKSQKTVARK